MRAFLCSQNASKLREFRPALPGFELGLLDADDYPPEDAATYLENARGKAVYGRSVEAGVWLFADDSGIEVAALGGAPGIATARWAADGVTHLLEQLDGAADRRARYVCELVALSPDGRELRGTGILEGAIATVRSGAEGFGYDPIFIPAGETATVAELGDAWKSINSHRALAAQALLASLASVASVNE